MARRRAPRATPQQFEVMVNFMTEHSCLVHQKLSNSLPATEREELWEELCSMLNGQTFGPQKTTFQWRRVWTDLKSEVKDKLFELRNKRQSSNSAKLLNPCHRKVADLLAKASSQCSFVEQRRVSSVSERGRDVGIKYEESINNQHSETESNSRVRPLVVSLNPSRTQPTETTSRNLVKCEETTGNDSSDPEYAQTENSNEDCESLEDNVNSTTPIFNKTTTKPKRRRIHKAVPEDTHLCNLIEVEKEKVDKLLAIAEAISSSNKNQEKLLKIEEERNKLIEQRNVIESERNDIFKSFFEHLKSRDPLTINI